MFFLMIRRPPRSTRFPTRRSSDLSLTLFAIVVTANHYIIDAVAGAAILGLGYLIASAITARPATMVVPAPDRKSTRLNSSHANISYAVFCLKKKNVIVTSQCSHPH